MACHQRCRLWDAATPSSHLHRCLPQRHSARQGCNCVKGHCVRLDLPKECHRTGFCRTTKRGLRASAVRHTRNAAGSDEGVQQRRGKVESFQGRGADGCPSRVDARGRTYLRGSAANTGADSRRRVRRAGGLLHRREGSEGMEIPEGAEVGDAQDTGWL